VKEKIRIISIDEDDISVTVTYSFYLRAS
jgi:hypothetical protein